MLTWKFQYVQQCRLPNKVHGDSIFYSANFNDYPFNGKENICYSLHNKIMLPTFRLLMFGTSQSVEPTNLFFMKLEPKTDLSTCKNHCDGNHRGESSDIYFLFFGFFFKKIHIPISRTV